MLRRNGFSGAETPDSGKPHSGKSHTPHLTRYENACGTVEPSVILRG